MANYALIIAGGSGCRMNQDIPKQFIKIDGIPVIIYTMKAFERNPEINGIAVVCLLGWEDELLLFAEKCNISKLKWIFPGGPTGMASIQNGIRGLKQNGCLDSDIVLIHDAVRPLVSQKIIATNIAICKSHRYAMTGIKCREAVMKTYDGVTTTKSIPRDSLIRVQTPQSYYLGDMISVYEEAAALGIKDSVTPCSLIADMGKERVIHIVPGEDINVKITTIEDLDLVKALMRIVDN